MSYSDSLRKAHGFCYEATGETEGWQMKQCKLCHQDMPGCAPGHWGMFRCYCTEGLLQVCWLEGGINTYSTCQMLWVLQSHSQFPNKLPKWLTPTLVPVLSSPHPGTLAAPELSCCPQTSPECRRPGTRWTATKRRDIYELIEPAINYMMSEKTGSEWPRNLCNWDTSLIVGIVPHWWQTQRSGRQTSQKEVRNAQAS